MNSPTRRLLEALCDKKWHVYDKLPKGIGLKTVQSCIDRGLVTTKRVGLVQSGDLETYHIAIRMTRLGKAALNKK